MTGIYRWIVCALLLWASCGDGITTTSRDLMELERVWQYMKAFSLYQDRIPSHESAFNFEDPYALVGRLNDTMRSSAGDIYLIGSYYPYCTTTKETAQISSPQAVQHGPVIVRKLTDSTLYARIVYFGDSLTDSMHLFDSLIQITPNLILDLTQNGGGSLEQCTAAVELMLPAGLEYLVSTYRRNILDENIEDTGTVHEKTWSTKRNNDGWEGKNIAVVFDSSSASAAEIMIVALKDALPGVAMVGTRSFGKGIGQYVFCFGLSSGAELRLTGFRFYRVAGDQRDYHERGIQPDYEVRGGRAAKVLFAGKLLEADFSLSESELARIIRPQTSLGKHIIPECRVSIDAGEGLLF